MDRLKLSVLDRVVGEKSKVVGVKEMIHAVVYGPKVKSRSIWVSVLDFQKIFTKAGENTLIDLEGETGKSDVVLIHDVQYAPLRGLPIHVDFFVVDMKENVETAVPLEFVGISAAIKEEGGVLIRNMEEIEVRCLPIDIPKSFRVDLSKLKTFDDCIYVKDIVHSEKYEALVDGESAVALVARPRKEEEDAVATVTPDQITTPVKNANND